MVHNKYCVATTLSISLFAFPTGNGLSEMRTRVQSLKIETSALIVLFPGTLGKTYVARTVRRAASHNGRRSRRMKRVEIKEWERRKKKTDFLCTEPTPSVFVSRVKLLFTTVCRTTIRIRLRTTVQYMDDARTEKVQYLVSLKLNFFRRQIHVFIRSIFCLLFLFKN